jgi:membrane dipeptidase
MHAPTRILFDAHLDLACLAVHRRDMLAPPERAGGPWPPAAITFPSLREGRMAGLLGTIFTEADGADAEGYPAGDARAAHRAGLAQLGLYHDWHERGLIDLGFTAGRCDPARPGCIILMEGADPIREPDELGWWVERGVRVVGLAWARGTRYAGGNSTPDRGLTDAGRALLEGMIAAGVVHDVSHLSRPAFDEAMLAHERLGGRIIASHSNCAALVDPANHRHLTDEQIRRIASHGGVIGLNLFRAFIRPGVDRADPADRPTIDQALRHVERVRELTGSAAHTGLGSDMDGGLSAHDLPAGINRPSDLHRLLEALASRGWEKDEIEAFAWGNWAGFFGVQRPSGPNNQSDGLHQHG